MLVTLIRNEAFRVSSLPKRGLCRNTIDRAGFSHFSGSCTKLNSSPPSHELNLHPLPSSSILSSEGLDDVLSTNDLITGILMAFALAFLTSFLQSQTPSSFNALLWPRERNADVSSNKISIPKHESENNDEEVLKNEGEQIVFSAENWKEMSRPENYIMYNNRVKPDNLPDTNPTRLDDTVSTSGDDGFKRKIDHGRENKLVLLALLILFVPIFSIEFFFALSRQFVCGDYLSTNVGNVNVSASPWADTFCSPHR